MDSDSDYSTYCSEAGILEHNTKAKKIEYKKVMEVEEEEVMEVEEEEIDYNVYNNGINSLECIFSAYIIFVVGVLYLNLHAPPLSG
jgi:hypothetical protein